MFELRALGSLELLRTGDGGTHAISMQAKRLALLAHLAVLPPHAFRRRDTLLLLFWPELDQEHARGALRQALHFLRKTLGEGAILTRGEDEIGLDPLELHSDVRGLEAALAAGNPEAALALYRGDFLEGVFVTDAAPELEDWISIERSRLRGLAAKAAWMASELPVNRDSVGELVRRAVQWSGDDEVALRRGVKILDGRGDRAGAAALYDEFARRVARDFDVELSAETRSVIKSLRARRASGQQDAPINTAQPVPAVIARESTAVLEPRRRLGRKLLVPGVAGALVVLALAAYIEPRNVPPPAAPSGSVTVVPFRVSQADSSLAWLGDGIVELLTVRLAGAPGAGAGRRVEGSVMGTRQHLILSASLSPAAGSLPVTRATVEGSADSMPQLLDGLAGQILGMSAGLDVDGLSSLSGVSLPAIRRYLAGLAAFRRGHMEAGSRMYSEALDLDSSFVLAGLQLCRARMFTVMAEQWQRGCHIALAGRDRLSPADRAMLDASPIEWTSSVAMFDGLDAAVRAYPSSAENWYALGDAHFTVGQLSGEERWAERADNAYRTGWMLDSARAAAMAEPRVAEPMQRMVELAHMRHDTAEVLRLVESVYAVDSTSELARVVMWHRALVTSDSARQSFWRTSQDATQRAVMRIVLFIGWTGIGTVDQERARAADEARLRVHDPGYSGFAFSLAFLNAGRPDEALPKGPIHGFPPDVLRRSRILWALSWDADTVAALRAVREIERRMAAPATGERARQQLFDACTFGMWQASRGNFTATEMAIARLRQAPVDSSTDAGATARYVRLCSTLLEAMRASGLRLPDSRMKVAAADSAARAFIFVICCGERLSNANIQIARLWEREGDLQAALRALSRRSERFGRAPLYMSTFLREEGRLAAMTGDTARAIAAWRHYLMYRGNPQASLKAGVDSIRQQLAVLEAR